MTEKKISNGIGVNFDERELGTHVRVAYKGAVTSFQCGKKLAQEVRARICTFFEKRGREYFREEGLTVTAPEASVLVKDLRAAGLDV